MMRIADEILTGRIDTGRFARMLREGWEIIHSKGTAYVSLRHPRGGKMDLLEVKTYGTIFTTGEADEVARIVAQLLAEHMNNADHKEQNECCDREQQKN